MSEIKIIRVNDYITIPFRGSKVKCPISRINMTNEDLREVIESKNAPTHIYALCPTDTSKSVFITKNNYMKSNKELFAKFYEKTEPVETVQVNVPVPEVFSADVVDEPTNPVDDVSHIEASVEDITDTDTVTENSAELDVSEVIDTNDTNDDSADEFLIGGNASSFADSDDEIVVEVENSAVASNTTEDDVVEVSVETPVETKQSNSYNNYNKKKKR